MKLIGRASYAHLVRVLTAFVDETGALHQTQQPFFGVGLLVVRNVGELTHRLHTVSLNLNAHLRERRKKLYREIEQNLNGQISLNEFKWLQQKTGHHEYKYTEIREHNLLDYRSVLDQFFAVTGGDSWPTYVMVTKTLLQRRIREPTFVCCDWQTRPKHNPLSMEDQLCGLPNVVGCLRITSETSAFLQITDLLLGVVSFDWREVQGSISQSKQAEAKRELGGFVKTKLRMPLSSRFLTPGRRYFCKQTPMKFSVWQPEPETLERLPSTAQKRRSSGPTRGSVPRYGDDGSRYPAELLHP